MAEKRKLTIATDFDLTEYRYQRAREQEEWPENEQRLKKLEVIHKIEGSNLSVEQLEIVIDLIDTLQSEENQQEGDDA